MTCPICTPSINNSPNFPRIWAIIYMYCQVHKRTNFLLFWKRVKTIVKTIEKTFFTILPVHETSRHSFVPFFSHCLPPCSRQVTSRTVSGLPPSLPPSPQHYRKTAPLNCSPLTIINCLSDPINWINLENLSGARLFWLVINWRVIICLLSKRKNCKSDKNQCFLI